MKAKKNRIVFTLVIIGVLLFIGFYTSIVLGEDEKPTIENNKIPVPKLEDEQKAYDSKLEALDDLKEVRQTNAPSIYDERLLDSTGLYDQDLLNKTKMRIVDSIYNEGRISYSDKTIRTPKPIERHKPVKRDSILKKNIEENEIQTKELALEHQLFFASNPSKNASQNFKHTDSLIYARVDGTQTVLANYRLLMRLIKAAKIGNHILPKNTAVYGFVSFKPNRTIINIEHIQHKPVKLKAFDFQDGSEGIYIENSFRAQASQEVIEDVVNDINIAGVPQVSGVKNIFQRNNRNVRVTVADNYKLILKPEP